MDLEREVNMSIVKARKIMDEICDNISGDAKEWIASIDRLEKKVSSLDAIIESMEEADENATFQLVAQLPSTGKTGIFYIVLNTTSNKYEEYEWNGTAFSKVGTIEDEVYPELLLTTQFYHIDHNSPEYEHADPSHEGWYTEDPETHEYTVSQDTHTYSSITYEAADKTAEGYSSQNPRSIGWCEYDDQTQEYSLSNDTVVDDGKTYYVGTKVYTKEYFVRENDYKLINPDTPGYSGMNPKHLDWYERDSSYGTFSPTTDTTVQNAKDYYVPAA